MDSASEGGASVHEEKLEDLRVDVVAPSEDEEQELYDQMVSLRKKMARCAIARLDMDVSTRAGKARDKELKQQLERYEEMLQMLQQVLKNQALSDKNSVHSGIHDNEATSSTTWSQATSARLPPNLPAFDPKRDNATMFISKFRNCLKANSYPEGLVGTALATCIQGAGAVWAGSNLPKATTWHAAERLFLEHFENSELIDHYEERLCTCKQASTESVREYADRFSGLLASLGKDEDDPSVLRRFRNSLHRKIQPFFAAAPTPTTFRAAVKLAQRLEYSVSGEDMERARVKREYSGVSKKCHYCGRLGHVEDKCHQKQRDRLKRNVKGAKPSVTIENKKDVTCFKCGGKGHYANKCTTASVLALAPTPTEDLKHGNNQASVVSPPAAADAVSPTVEDAGRGQHQSVEYEAQNINHPNHCIGAAVYIQDEPVWALVDTGSSRSCLTPDLVKSLGLKPEPIEGTLATAGPQSTVHKRQQVWCTLASQGKVYFWAFEVLDLPGWKALLGMDILPLLGIAVVNVPFSHDKPSMVNDIPFEVPQDVVSRPHERREEIVEAVQEAMLRNEAIPASEACNHPLAQVTLETEGGPIFRRQYPIPHSLRPAVNKKVQEWVDNGVVVPAPPDSQYNAPLTVAPKKDLEGNISKTDVRVCLDPRGLNEILRDDQYPIPVTRDILQELLAFEVVSCLDLKESYHQLQIAEGHRHKTTFTWGGKRLMFSRAPFGLKHLTAHFQRCMEAVLQDHQAYAKVFVDDIIVFSKSVEEHKQHLRDVVNTLSAANLRLRPAKCKIGYTAVKILGHVLDGHCLRPDPTKISSFVNLPEPVTGRQVASLLGCASYLRDYIPLYSKLAAPLEQLKGCKDVRPYWNEGCKTSFELLKEALSQAPVLSVPDWNRELYVNTDASLHGVGAVLYQYNDDGTHRYIAFVSKALNAAQRRYPATKRELYGIVFALTKLREYLYGRRFVLRTDHQALTYLHRAKRSMTIGWWQDIIGEFDFEVQHCPGVRNVLADGLSRLYDFESLELPEVPDEAKRKSKKKCVKATTQLRATDCQDAGEVVLPIAIDDRHSSKMITFQEMNADRIDPGEEQRISTLEALHALGHFGADQLFQQAWRRGYFWKGMRRDCTSVTAKCQACRQFNIARHGFHPLVPIHAELPFDQVHVDLFGPLSTSAQGYNYVLVIVDVCTRFCLLRPLPDKTADTTARALYHAFCDFGFPKILVSDNGREFVNSVVEQLKTQSGFDHRVITPYYPQANGLAESHVKMAKNLLFKLMHGNTAEWERFVPAVQVAMNGRIARRHGSAPFSLMFGRAQNPFIDFQGVESSPAEVEAIASHFQEMHEVVFPAILEKAKDSSGRIKEAVDRRRKLVEYHPGDLVMIRKLDRRKGSDPLFMGPYTVLRRNKGGSYLLQDATGALYDHNIPSSHLKLISRATAVTEAEELSFEVDRIENHRGTANAREYLVRWKGDTERTWEPAANFDDPQPIEEYWRNRLGRGR